MSNGKCFVWFYLWEIKRMWYQMWIHALRKRTHIIIGEMVKVIALKIRISTTTAEKKKKRWNFWSRNSSFYTHKTKEQLEKLRKLVLRPNYFCGNCCLGAIAWCKRKKNRREKFWQNTPNALMKLSISWTFKSSNESSSSSSSSKKAKIL